MFVLFNRSIFSLIFLNQNPHFFFRKPKITSYFLLSKIYKNKTNLFPHQNPNSSINLFPTLLTKSQKNQEEKDRSNNPPSLLESLSKRNFKKKKKNPSSRNSTLSTFETFRLKSESALTFLKLSIFS